MKKTLLTCFILTLGANSFAQEQYTEEWGRVTQHEMTMTEFEGDKDAEALVIYDLGDYRFTTDYTKGFLLVMERKTKIKILKQAGEKYANFNIYYYTGEYDWEEIQNIEAVTYNWNGKELEKTPLNPKNIFEEKVNDNVRFKKIALANVKEGSVIEFKYTISTPYFVNMRKWDFQQKIPVLHSELMYHAIPYYEYSYILKGSQRFDKMESSVNENEKRFRNLVYKEMDWTFGMNNLPAFRDEEFITSPNNYMVNLNFQISKIYFAGGGQKEYISTWPQLATDFAKDSDFGGYIKNSAKEAKKILPSLELEGKTQLEQAQTITRYVKYMYNWNQYYGLFASGKVSDFIKQKTGNVVDMNLFLVGLLQGAGLDANAVIVSTREHGAISKLHPFRSFFNYVIAQVQIGDNKYFMDATESLLDFDELPERCIHIEGLVIKPKTEEWIFTEQRNEALTDREFNISVNPENKDMTVQAHYSTLGYNAYKYRGAYLGKMNNLKDYLKDETGFEITSEIKLDNYDDLNKPFTFDFSFNAPTEDSGDKIFINPFCGQAISENPFKQNQRALAVDLVYFRSNKYKSTITIPQGYVVEYIPKSTKHNSALLTFNYTAQQTDDKVEVIADFAYKKNVYPPQEYNRLKLTMTAIIKHLSEMIIIKKQE